MSYRRHYDVPLLDDLHNYLPEILYGQPEQFGGAAPLVSYVQRQMQQRFDLFSAGRRSFTPTPDPVMTPPRRTRMTEPPPLYRVPPIIELNYPTNQNTFIDSLLGTVLNQYMYTPPVQNTMDPPVLRPTPEQLAAGTSIEVVDTEDVCAICQDIMPSGSEARELRCEHQFHPGCIDTWFQRSVACPTCRHDIRVPIVDAPVPPLNGNNTPNNSGARTN